MAVSNRLPPADPACAGGIVKQGNLSISLVVLPDIEVGGEGATERQQSRECERDQFQIRARSHLTDP
jgi:hypothetical protein